MLFFIFDNIIHVENRDLIVHYYFYIYIQKITLKINIYNL